MKTSQVTDPNDNRTRYGFTPLGMLKKTAVMGKDGESKGDTLTDPTQYLEYDFFAYMTNGNPAWVKNIQREEHYYDNSSSDTIALARSAEF